MNRLRARLQQRLTYYTQTTDPLYSRDHRFPTLTHDVHQLRVPFASPLKKKKKQYPSRRARPSRTYYMVVSTTLPNVRCVHDRLRHNRTLVTFIVRSLHGCWTRPCKTTSKTKTAKWMETRRVHETIIASNIRTIPKFLSKVHGIPRRSTTNHFSDNRMSFTYRLYSRSHARPRSCLHNCLLRVR